MQITSISSNVLKQKNNVSQIENSLNSSFRSINLKHEDKNANKIEVIKLKYHVLFIFII